MYLVQFSCSVMSDFLQPHGLQHARPPCPSSLKDCPRSCHWISYVIQPSHPLMPSSPLPSIVPNIRNFSNKWTVCIRWPKYWSFNFSISPSNEYSEWISLKIDWFNLFAVQWTLRSLLQHHSSKASIFWHSAFFTVQLLQPYMTTGKTIGLTILTFISAFQHTV